MAYLVYLAEKSWACSEDTFPPSLESHLVIQPTLYQCHHLIPSSLHPIPLIDASYLLDYRDLIESVKQAFA